MVHNAGMAEILSQHCPHSQDETQSSRANFSVRTVTLRCSHGLSWGPFPETLVLACASKNELYNCYDYEIVCQPRESCFYREFKALHFI